MSSPLTPRINKLEDPTLLDDELATQLGKKEYVHGVDFTIGYDNGTWSILYGYVIPYQMQDGSWRMKLHLDASGDAQTAQLFSFSGVTFWDGGRQALTTSEGSNDTGVDGETVTDDSRIICRRASGANFNGVTVSGDVKLKSKPSWAA